MNPSASGLGIAFARQYQQAGLLDKIPMVVPGVSVDHSMLKALGEAAIGVNATTHWNADFNNEVNRKFVAEFQKKYGRVPTIYAAQGYDTAHAIGSALRATKGDLSDAEAFRREMLKANFQSVRGPFKFGTNQHPVQEWWATKVERSGDGKIEIVTKTKVFESRGDSYAEDCKL